MPKVCEDQDGPFEVKALRSFLGIHLRSALKPAIEFCFFVRVPEFLQASHPKRFPIRRGWYPEQFSFSSDFLNRFRDIRLFQTSGFGSFATIFE